MVAGETGGRTFGTFCYEVSKVFGQSGGLEEVNGQQDREYRRVPPPPEYHNPWSDGCKWSQEMFPYLTHRAPRYKEFAGILKNKTTEKQTLAESPVLRM